MFGYVVRRMLGAVPALLLFAIVLFSAISLSPPPDMANDELERRFWHLPLIVNLSPEDRPRYVTRLVKGLGDDLGQRREQDLRRLLRIGAAGLPDLVTALEGLDLRTRVRVARELAPLAFRMGLDDVHALEDERAPKFWARVLDDRGADLRASSVRRALQRHLADRNEPLYARQLRNADTAVLAPIFEELPSAEHDTREALEALAIGALQRAGVTYVRDATGLHSYWAVHRSEYVEFGALERIAGRLTETRFGRWVTQAITSRFGRSWRTNVPVLPDIASRAPLTLARTVFGLLLAYLIAVPVSVWAAARRGGVFDRVTNAVLLVVHAFPAFVLAMMARAFAPRLARTDAFVALAVAVVALAPITRHMRSRLLEEVRQDWVRTSRAMGLPSFSIWTRDIGRSAFGSIFALSALEIPTLLGMTMLAEEILSLDGLGPAVMASVRFRDVPWLMAFALLAAAISAGLLLLSDVVQAVNDPRVRKAMLSIPEDT